LVTKPTAFCERSNSLLFCHYELLSTSMSFLRIRVGARRTRHRLIEMSGAQVSSVVIEKAEQKVLRDYEQLVVSGAEEGGVVQQHSTTDVGLTIGETAGSDK
jgi:hypothetical protein